MSELKPQKIQKFQLNAEKDHNVNGLYIYLDSRYNNGQLAPDSSKEIEINGKTLIIDFNDNKIIGIEILGN